MISYPLEKAFMFIEPGPVVLVTTAGEDHPNIMTISWTMVLDFSPRFAFMTGAWNYSYEALRRDKECIISIPTVQLAEKTVQIGSCSGREVNKFEKFGLTPVKASLVMAPLIKECYANLECRIIDYIDGHGIFVLDCKKAWINKKEKSPKFFHAIGDGRFIKDGEEVSYREIMIDKLPPGV
jgi:flavin reductase (DIM6/NTAB) family NADH-FMN oxidoreductase RutF